MLVLRMQLTQRTQTVAVAKITGSKTPRIRIMHPLNAYCAQVYRDPMLDRKKIRIICTLNASYAGYYDLMLE